MTMRKRPPRWFVMAVWGGLAFATALLAAVVSAVVS